MWPISFNNSRRRALLLPSYSLGKLSNFLKVTQLGKGLGLGFEPRLLTVMLTSPCFPLLGCRHFKDAGVWHRLRGQLDKHQSGNRGSGNITTSQFWSYPDSTLEAQKHRVGTGCCPVQAWSRLWPGPAASSLCSRLHCDSVWTNASRRNLAPPDICISFLEPPGHHWAPSPHWILFIFPSVNPGLLNYLCAFLWTLQFAGISFSGRDTRSVQRNYNTLCMM